QHMPSVTPGNEGVEIRVDAGVPNDAHTLLGLIRTNTNTNFIDQPTDRWVRSWYGERRVPLMGNIASGVQTANVTSWNPMGNLASFLTWNGEAVWLQATGFCDSNAAAGPIYTGVMVDGNQSGSTTYSYSWGSGVFTPHSPTHAARTIGD